MRGVNLIEREQHRMSLSIVNDSAAWDLHVSGNATKRQREALLLVKALVSHRSCLLCHDAICLYSTALQGAGPRPSSGLSSK